MYLKNYIILLKLLGDIMDFTDSVILVTGASRGIGLYLSNLLTEYGAKVIGVYNKTKIKNVNFDTYKCDISNELEIKKLMNYIKINYGSLDVVVNCAALCLDNDLYDKTKKEFMKVLEVNLVGTFLICKYASLLMKKGVIVNISSTDAEDTFSTFSMDYAASKAGLENLTKNLALRLPNIKICAISPNWIDTETVLEMNQEYLKNELKRIGQKELLKKEEVVNKIIEIIVNDDIVSGDIIRMVCSNE